MVHSPRTPEIDHHTIKLIVGIIALTLGPLVNLFAAVPLTSISASYYSIGLPQSIFIGFLFATAAFLLSYNGESGAEMVLSKVAAVAALAVALVPCQCDGRAVTMPFVHGLAAAVMFLILTYFCYCFRQRAIVKPSKQSKLRALIYTLCAAVMVLSILALALDHLTHGTVSRHDPWLTYQGEYAALTAFGISWLTASRMLPLITAREERLKLIGQGVAGAPTGSASGRENAAGVAQGGPPESP
ncbi:MAG TPA: hypothetical protein VMJ30_01765 [Gemmatimonadales bacterium]|nr:hypothetical protein [Gemmatimonadales bacterium]